MITTAYKIAKNPQKPASDSLPFCLQFDPTLMLFGHVYDEILITHYGDSIATVLLLVYYFQIMMYSST